MTKKLVLGVLIAGLLLAGGVAYAVVPGARHRAPSAHPSGPTSTVPPTTISKPPASLKPRPGQPAIRLVSYGGCPDLLNQVKAEAVREVGPYGLSNRTMTTYGVAASGVSNEVNGAVPMAEGAAAGTGSVAAGATRDAAAAPAAPSSYSGTNNQEVGVDEPDLVKTDGHLLLVLRHQPMGLEVTDVSSSAPRLDGFLALPGLGSSNEMFITGQYAVVLGASQWAGPPMEPPVPAPGPLQKNGSTGATASSAEIATPVYQQPSTRAVVVSLADPTHPEVVRTFDLQGSEAGARLIAGRIEVVLQGQPNLPFVTPVDGSPTSSSAATARNQAVIAGSTVSDWLPSVSVSPGGQTWHAACQTAVHPSVPSGLDTVSIVSLDPASATPGPEVTAVGNATTVYASTTSLYVATTSWSEQMYSETNPSFTPPSTTTDIHEFDLSDPAHPTYVASGWVPGNLIGQYALSEYQGVLRVATTVGSAAPPPNEGVAPTVPSDNRVVLLRPEGTALTPIGSIGGLGQGEKIYGVRFVGPLGYVVTFRQTDPLYILDLTSPTHPVLDGQLALTGFSSFLQPLGGGLMLGVGQGVDPNLRQTGLQLSVFDVSHPNAPVLRSRVDLGMAQSPAENDAHALLWWPASRMLALPLSDYQNNFDGIGVWHVDTDGTLHQVARLAQPQPPQGTCSCGAYPAGGGVAAGPAMPVCACFGSVQRAVVIGDLLYTTSENGIMANNMDSWTRAAWLPFS